MGLFAVARARSSIEIRTVVLGEGISSWRPGGAVDQAVEPRSGAHRQKLTVLAFLALVWRCSLCFLGTHMISRIVYILAHGLESVAAISFFDLDGVSF